jgi:hypothetical protein
MTAAPFIVDEVAAIDMPPSSMATGLPDDTAQCIMSDGRLAAALSEVGRARVFLLAFVHRKATVVMWRRPRDALAQT